MPAANLIRTLQSGRTGVTRIKVDLWREREAGTEDDDSTYVPSAKNRIDYATLIQVLPAFSHRQFVVDADYPTHAIIKVCQSLFCADVEAVLRPGRIAANFGLIVNCFAQRKRT